MERCTLSRTFVCSLAGLALVTGCGDDDEPTERTERFERTPLNRPAESGRESRRACALVRPREIGRLLRRPGVAFRASPNDSTDLSICDWRGAGVRVQLIVDSAPRAQLRYYNQLAEQLQFHNPEPDRRPHKLKRVGDDDAYGGAGAWWTPSKRQLVAYADERILRIRTPRRDPAVRLARLAFERLSEPGR
jgi:hypothetical protein